MAKTTLRAEVERRASDRCEYCHAPQSVCGYRFHLEHIIPLAKNGTDALANRALACASCNLAKTDKVSGIDPSTGKYATLFNPREQLWTKHFHWEEKRNALIGNTPTGRATITALDMNSELRLGARQLWFTVGFLP